MPHLVTGATGFLGSAIVRLLLAQGGEVRAFARVGSDLAALAELDVEVVRGDITDPASLRDVCRGVADVYHTVGVPALSESNSHYIEVDVLGTRNLLAAAESAGNRRVVVATSATTVGSAQGDRPATEDGVWDLATPSLPYFTAKFLAEFEAMRAAARGLDVVVVNPSTILGERARLDSPMARWLVEYLNGRLLAVPPVYLNVVDVEDAARGALLAAEKGRRGERYLLTNANTTAADLLTAVGKLVGRRPPLQVPYEVAFAGATVGGALGELLGISANVSASLTQHAHKKLHYSNGKAVRELGFAPRPIEDTIEKTVRWLNASGLVKRRL